MLVHICATTPDGAAEDIPPCENDSPWTQRRHSLNLLCAVASCVYERVRCSTSSSSCFLTAVSCCGFRLSRFTAWVLERGSDCYESERLVGSDLLVSCRPVAILKCGSSKLKCIKTCSQAHSKRENEYVGEVSRLDWLTLDMCLVKLAWLASNERGLIIRLQGLLCK